MKKGLKIGLIIVIVLVLVILCAILLNNNKKSSSVEDILTTTTDTTTSNTNNTKEEDNKINTNGKILVLYFSWGGTTEKLANEIKDYTNADIEEIHETDKYTTDYDDLTKIAQKEKQDNARPKYNSLKSNIQDYDVIFVGYPIWWMDMPMIMYNLFENENFDGKTVIPFITSYSSGESGTTRKIQNILKNSTVKDALHIYDSDMSNYKETTDKFLNNLGYTK